jgi:hypothetical protein
MIRNAAKRTASLAALAAAAGLIWSTAPAWACAPPPGGSSSGGGESHQGPDTSGYNGAAAEGARQGASDAAAGLDNSGDGGPARSSPATAPNLEGVIDAVGGALAADDAKRCAQLRVELMSAQASSMFMANYDSTSASYSDDDKPSQETYDLVVKATPAQLDAQIAYNQARTDAWKNDHPGERAPPPGRTDSFVRDLRASQMLGLEDDVKKKYQQQVDAANKAAAARAAQAAARTAQQQAKIRDLQSQISDLGCNASTANAAPSPPGADASQ